MSQGATIQYKTFQIGGTAYLWSAKSVFVVLKLK